MHPANYCVKQSKNCIKTNFFIRSLDVRVNRKCKFLAAALNIYFWRSHWCHHIAVWAWKQQIYPEMMSWFHLRNGNAVLTVMILGYKVITLWAQKETRAHKKLVYLYGSAGTSIIVTFSCNLSCLKTSTALLQRSVHSVLLLFSRSEVTMTRSWSLTSLKYYINNGIASFFKKLSSLNKHVMWTHIIMLRELHYGMWRIQRVLLEH